jgi:hypothetical protein
MNDNYRFINGEWYTRSEEGEWVKVATTTQEDCLHGCY